MKTELTLVLAVAATLLPSVAQDPEIKISEQEIRALGPLPDEKVVESLKKGERNPFAEKVVIKATDTGEDMESETARLRAAVGKLPLRGRISTGDGRLAIVLGRQLLHEGDKLPPLIENQTALLRVSSITSDKVEIAFVEDQASATPQKIFKTFEINDKQIRQVVTNYGDGGERQAASFTVPRTTNGEFLKGPEKSAEPETEEQDVAPTTTELRSHPAPARSNPLRQQNKPQQ